MEKLVREGFKICVGFHSESEDIIFIFLNGFWLTATLGDNIGSGAKAGAKDTNILYPEEADCVSVI